MKKERNLEIKLRKARLKILKELEEKHGSFEKIPKAKKLELQPIVKSDEERFLSLLALMYGKQRETIKENLFEKLEKFKPILIKIASKNAKVNENEYKKIIKKLNDKKLLEKLDIYATKKFSYENEEEQLKQILPQQLNSKFIEEYTKLMQIFLNVEPKFYKTEKKFTKINVMPGFESFIKKLKEISKNDITSFIEKQKLVERTKEMALGLKPLENAKIQSLIAYPYDITKIREFSLEDEKGNTIEIVSKRLEPIKSAFAENEFKISIELKKAGIPVPEPIAEIKDKGNTYFLWKKIKPIENIPSIFSQEIKRQKNEIAEKLKEKGFIATDLADRNFVVTLEYNKPKVYLVDFERIYKKLK